MPERWTKSFPLPPGDGGPDPVSYRRSERRVFGLTPGGLLAVVAAAAVVAGIALIAGGRLVVGPVLLALGAALAALWADQAVRYRRTRLDRLAVEWAERTRWSARFAARAGATWTGTGGRLALARLEAGSLARRRRPLLVELGKAAYRGDEERSAALRARLRDLDRRIAACRERGRSAVDDARRRVGRERFAVQATEPYEPLR